MRERRREQGFTLIELLVVVVILSLLAAVVVFVVQGLPQRGEEAAEDADRKTLRHAEEAYFISRTAPEPQLYATEDGLVAAGFLTGPSTIHDVCLNGDRTAYVIVAAGTDCSTVTFS